MSGQYRIEDHAVIGDLHTVALVALDGTISFLCVPSFDSPSVFASLLDQERGGRFELAPAFDAPTHRQLYLPDTNVLLTRFLARRRRGRDLRLHARRGRRHASQHRPARQGRAGRRPLRHALRAALRLRPRDPHGASGCRTASSSRPARPASPCACARPCLSRSTVPTRRPGSRLRSGEAVSFVLEFLPETVPSPCDRADYVVDSFKATTNFWRRWAGGATYRGRWREMVMRSALTLKLLTSQQHGSIVAAPTFGLPERIGGTRNWDYRYTWIRDASFTLYGLMRLGYTDESAAFMKWVEARCAELEPDGSLQIMYGLDGRHELPEEELPHLDGYLGLAPRAHRQRRREEPAARHLRRADGRHLPVRQVRRRDLLRLLVEHPPPHRLGLRQLAAPGREHLGGARRQARVPLLAGAVLGGDRPRDPPRRCGVPSPGPSRVGTTSGTRSTRTSSRASGTPSAAPSCSRRARRRWTRRRCSCRSSASSRRPTRAGCRRCGRSTAASSRTRSSTGIASTTSSRTGCRPAKARSRCARSGTSSACRAPATSARRGTTSRRCWATPTTSASTARSSDRARSTSGNFPQAFTHVSLISAAFDLDRRLSAAGHPA